MREKQLRRFRWCHTSVQKIFTTYFQEWPFLKIWSQKKPPIQVPITMILPCIQTYRHMCTQLLPIPPHSPSPRHVPLPLSWAFISLFTLGSCTSPKNQSITQPLREIFPNPPRENICPSPVFLAEGKHDPIINSIYNVTWRKLSGIKRCWIHLEP